MVERFMLTVYVGEEMFGSFRQLQLRGEMMIAVDADWMVGYFSDSSCRYLSGGFGMMGSCLKLCVSRQDRGCFVPDGNAARPPKYPCVRGVGSIRFREDGGRSSECAAGGYRDGTRQRIEQRRIEIPAMPVQIDWQRGGWCQVDQLSRLQLRADEQFRHDLQIHADSHS